MVADIDGDNSKDPYANFQSDADLRRSRMTDNCFLTRLRFSYRVVPDPAYQRRRNASRSFFIILRAASNSPSPLLYSSSPLASRMATAGTPLSRGILYVFTSSEFCSPSLIST